MLENCPDVPLEILKRQKSRHTKYHPALKSFALTLQFYSAKAYNYVRETFDLGLPHPSTIRRWYSSNGGDPGFSEDVLASLQIKAAAAQAKGQETGKLQWHIFWHVEWLVQKGLLWCANAFSNCLMWVWRWCHLRVMDHQHIFQCSRTLEQTCNPQHSTLVSQIHQTAIKWFTPSWMSAICWSWYATPWDPVASL